MGREKEKKKWPRGGSGVIWGREEGTGEAKTFAGGEEGTKARGRQGKWKREINKAGNKKKNPKRQRGARVKKNKTLVWEEAASGSQKALELHIQKSPLRGRKGSQCQKKKNCLNHGYVI